MYNFDELSCLNSTQHSNIDTKKKTIYERIKLIYSRNSQFQFLAKQDYNGGCDSEKLLEALESLNFKQKQNWSESTVVHVDQISLIIWEHECSVKGVFIGAVTEFFNTNTFDRLFLNLVIQKSNIFFPSKITEDTGETTDAITELFAKELKNISICDKWKSTGEIYFKEKISFFVSRGSKIEAVLPAFPCKSSNYKKVATWRPDKGEELGLTKLISFTESVKKIYAPGILIWIVSDGHVFSDCIGVNDSIVDEYSNYLKQLYDKIKPLGSDECIQFRSLSQLFSLEQFKFNESLTDNVNLNHYLGTQLNPEAELCRKILIESCDTNSENLKNEISQEHHPRLYLYRGFSKFMTEDLALNPLVPKMSRKNYKRMVCKIAFEMIKRNDAYSNLVELIFPLSVRFSIHAHNNSGPKFGIRLLDSKECRVIKSLDENGTPDLSDLLHIPTPWHNCVLRIQGLKHYYVTKSEIIAKALEIGSYKGTWDKEENCYIIERQQNAKSN